MKNQTDSTPGSDTSAAPESNASLKSRYPKTMAVIDGAAGVIVGATMLFGAGALVTAGSVTMNRVLTKDKV